MPFWTHIPPHLCLHQDALWGQHWGSWRRGWGHGPQRSRARGKERKVAHPEDQHFSILQPGIRAATAHDSHSPWGPAFCLPSTHGGPCLCWAWPVWLWSGAFLGPSLGEPVELMHTHSLRAMVLHHYYTSCLHLCPRCAYGWTTALPISFALRTGNLGQPSTSHRWEKR